VILLSSESSYGTANGFVEILYTVSSSHSLSFEDSMEGKGLVAHLAPLHDLIMLRCFLLSLRDGRVLLLMFDKDRVVMWSITLYLSIYLSLLPRCARF